MLAGDTVERFALQGSCYKRLAQVTTGRERKEALHKMADAYQKACERSRTSGRLDGYPAQMHVAAQVAINCLGETPDRLSKELQLLLEEATRVAAEDDEANPNFWKGIAAADSLLLKALDAGELDATKRKEVEEAYLRHWTRGGSWLHLQSVIEQLDFFIDVWNSGVVDRKRSKRLRLREEIKRLRGTLATRVQPSD